MAHEAALAVVSWPAPEGGIQSAFASLPLAHLRLTKESENLLLHHFRVHLV
jgi:hypothetical protein